MLQPNRHGSEVSYRYGFQAQEKDDELKGEGNSLNYTFRMHDPRVGRFFATDPLESKYPYLTPYQFSSNQPIHTFELEGMESADEISPDPGRRKSNTRKEGDVSCGDVYHCGSEGYEEGWYSESDYKKIFPTAVRYDTYTKIRTEENGKKLSYTLPLATAEKSKIPMVAAGIFITGTAIIYMYNNSVNTKSWYEIPMPTTAVDTKPVAIDLAIDPSSYDYTSDDIITEAAALNTPLLPIYRGVSPPENLVLGERNAWIHAQFGVAMPRGWGYSAAAETTVISHVNDNDTFSFFTSWTTSEMLARGHAGPNGIVLVKYMSLLETSTMIPSFKFSRYGPENEWSLFGPRKADRWYWMKNIN